MKRDQKTLFLSARGTAFSRQGVYLIVKKYAARVSTDLAISPHMLRHSFATHLLDGEANLRDVQELLGHENITSTEIYTHVSKEAVKKQYREFHPRQ